MLKKTNRAVNKIRGENMIRPRNEKTKSNKRFAKFDFLFDSRI